MPRFISKRNPQAVFAVIQPGEINLQLLLFWFQSQAKSDTQPHFDPNKHINQAYVRLDWPKKKKITCWKIILLNKFKDTNYLLSNLTYSSLKDI